MTYRPAKTKRRRRDDIDQARFDLRPHDGKSDLDREVQEHAEQTRREPLPGCHGKGSYERDTTDGYLERFKKA